MIYYQMLYLNNKIDPKDLTEALLSLKEICSTLMCTKALKILFLFSRHMYIMLR